MIGMVGFGRVEFFILIRNVWDVFIGIGELVRFHRLLELMERWILGQVPLGRFLVEVWNLFVEN